MALTDPTYIGQVASVTGNIVRVRLRLDIPTTLVLVEGESYRIGQVGGFFRIPLGYTQLYGICSQVGADAAPPVQIEENAALETKSRGDRELSGYRWMVVTLFGESVGRVFERGVGQYPTIGDEVHFVTLRDLKVIYERQAARGGVAVGTIAACASIPAKVDIAKLVSRHCAVVGSTGSGKSNLVTVLLEAISAGEFPSARVLVIDPHGEHTALGPELAKVFRTSPDETDNPLRIPFWALPFDELRALSFGEMQGYTETAIRDIVVDMKRNAAKLLPQPPPNETLGADSPVPFSIKQLWFDLDDFERQTYRKHPTTRENILSKIVEAGSADALTSNKYEPYKLGSAEPFKNVNNRGISKQLELLKSRLQDERFEFLYNPGAGYTPDLSGKIQKDLDTLVADWVGHDKPLTILDVSSVPSEVTPTIVGLLLRMIYDTLFWGMDLAVGGRKQPLLIVLEEAHRFLPETTGTGTGTGTGTTTNKAETPANRTVAKIAKEGRKYGVGLVVVTQRPSEIDSTVLSQCGTMVALRLSNQADRSKVAAAFPDDLGGLVDLLPSLRTGEGLFMGEAMFIPSRVRVRLTTRKTAGGDPDVVSAWQKPARPPTTDYTKAIRNWRQQGRKDPN
jgi:uncharacterized protein